MYKIDLDKYIVIIIYLMSETKLQTPFIKWVGGKTQIIDKIVSKIPTEMENYHELFLRKKMILMHLLLLKKNLTHIPILL